MPDPTTRPATANPNQHPEPRSTLPLIAPNKQHEVQLTIDTHPEIDTMDEEARGEIIDITARRINPKHGEKPWGRKARNNDANNPNCNTDGMTYLRIDGLFEIYDCISGIDGESSWEGYGPYAPGENGYWWPPNPVEDTGGGGDGGGGGSELEGRVAALEAQVAELQADNQALAENGRALAERLTAVEQKQAQPYRAHGPVDLPIVLESLTRLRCKGDIDVEVKPGQATPPATSEGDPPSLVDVGILKRILERLRPDEPERPDRPGDRP
jgi:hypothetical protein